MAEELQSIVDRGFRVVFLDETMITKSTMPTHEWSGCRDHFQVDFNQFAGKSIAVLAGVSMERGVDLMMTFNKSVNIEKFKVYLDELRARWFFDDICIVMDNLRVHHSNAVMERIEELGFEYVFTPVYTPDLNPIESVFSQFKNKLKRERFMAIQHDTDICLTTSINRIWGDLEREKIINCIIHCMNLLKINH